MRTSPAPPIKAPQAAIPDDAKAAEHQRAVALLRSATHVEAFRVRSELTDEDLRRQTDPRYKDRYVADLPIERRGPVMGREFAQRVTAFLLDEANFVPAPGRGKACIF